MTPREPDRFDAQAEAPVDRMNAGLEGYDQEAIAAALRAAESSALERATQEIRTLDLDHIGALEGSREATRRVILDRLEHGETWQHPCACEKHRPAAVSARTPDPLREASEYCPLREPYIAAKARIAELESALIPPAAAPAAYVRANACQVDLRTDKDRECFDDVVRAATRVLRAPAAGTERGPCGACNGAGCDAGGAPCRVCGGSGLLRPLPHAPTAETVPETLSGDVEFEPAAETGKEKGAEALTRCIAGQRETLHAAGKRIAELEALVAEANRRLAKLAARAAPTEGEGT